MKLKITKKNIREFILINFGIILVAFSFVFYLDPNNIIYGGVSGLAIIIKNIITPLFNSQDAIPTSWIILILNIILMVVGYIFLGKKFIFKTIYGSLAYPVYAFLFECIYKVIDKKWHFFSELYQIGDGIEPTIETSILLQSNHLLLIIIAAAITGIGLGIVLKADASTGGIDILQAIFLKYFKIPYSKSLIIFDGSIIFGGVLFLYHAQTTLFLSMLLYGAIFVIISGYVIDSIVFSGFNSRAVYIITDKHEDIKNAIYKHFNRGVTEVYSRGGYTGIDRKMLLCVMSTREFNILRSLAKEIDPSIFIFIVKASEVHGEGFSYLLDDSKGENNEPS